MKKIITIEQKIHVVRARKVMLDADLAELYGVTTKAFNQAVKRNLTRFPEDFLFQITAGEYDVIRSQDVTASKRNIRFLPYAFTEHGAVMCANILRSDRAVEASVTVVRAFIRMRGIIAEYKELAARLDKLEAKYDKHFKIVFDAIRRLMTPPKKTKPLIGFKPRATR